MALWMCQECTTAYAVGLPACPHCQSTDYEEDGAMPPKITVHGGPSIAGATVVGGAWSDEDEPGAWPEEAAPDEGGEEPSPGNSSSASPEKPTTKSDPSDPAPQKRARTTGSRSPRARTGNSSARSTAGGQTEPTSGNADGGGR